MIAIHNGMSGFHPEWIKYCIENNIDYKIVNCYDSEIIDHLQNCDSLMWHFSQNDPKDLVIAKQILFSLEQSGKNVFPNFNTMWHFDDKLGQKYLLEALNLQMVKSYGFYSKKDALEWTEKTVFPKVFKLRGGAGSSNVSLVKTKYEAKGYINKAFGSGFSNYNGWAAFKDTLRLYRMSKVDLIKVFKSFVRIFIKPQFAKVMGKEVNYIYFQDFIPNNSYDIRVIVIDGKTFAIKRLVRKGDFRASGSGSILYDNSLFEINTIELALISAKKLKSQCVAFDFVYDAGVPLIVEISYGFATYGYWDCEGYWDDSLTWHAGPFNPYGWMVDLIKK